MFTLPAHQYRASGLRQVRLQSQAIELTWQDGLREHFSFCWLRDQDPDSRHENGQKLTTLQHWPEDIRPEHIRQEGDYLMVTWAGDGHQTVLHQDTLRRAVYRPARLSSGEQVLWNRMLDQASLYFDYDSITRPGQQRLEWLETLADYGFAGLTGVPATPMAVGSVIALFGQIRETNFGRIFDIRPLANPNNLSDSNLDLPPRTENPYRDPAPGLHAIHCLKSSREGGDILLVDGWFVGQKVKRKLPEGFDLLTRIPVRFQYQDDKVWLEHKRCLIGLDAEGEFRSIAFNNRSVDPFSLPASQQAGWYQAYRELEREILSPANQVRIRLEPGDMLLINNRRVLHGQTAFGASSQRLLRGCYAEADGLQSEIRRLRAQRLAGA